jgi:hypothetical protein
MASGAFRLTGILIFFSALSPAYGVDCFREFTRTLKVATDQPQIDSFLDYDQKRFNWIYPEVYQLTDGAAEAIELTHTYGLLELNNAKKKLISESENNFSVAYSVFKKKGRPTQPIHDYFRSIARGDIEQAKSIGDQILAEFDPSKRAKVGDMVGIHGSDHPSWATFEKPREIRTNLISYHDDLNDAATGVKIEINLPEKNKQKAKLEQLAQAMNDKHNVTIASVPPAIESLNSMGFSTRQGEFINLEAKARKITQGPMIVIPAHDVEFGKISHTTKHEARHAFYNTSREKRISSAYDGHFRAMENKTIGETGGYSKYQSFEELSTHPKDLIDAFRTGNREILDLYKTREYLMANKVIDIPYLESKCLTVQKISEQSAQAAKESIEELVRKKTAPYSDIGVIGISHGKEGYRFEFAVKDQYYTNVFFSSTEERMVVSDFFDDFEAYQKAVVEAGSTSAKIDPELERKGREALSRVLSAAEKKLAQTQKMAEETLADSQEIMKLVDRFQGGDLKLTREQYLKARDIITRPASRVNGFRIRKK